MPSGQGSSLLLPTKGKLIVDISETTAPRSDQINYDDVAVAPRTVTIVEVLKGASPEQPVDIVLTEYGPERPFKPSKTVRRVLIAAWGSDSTVYAGRQMTIYGDPAVKFGGQAVGGIRVSHLSHIKEPLSIALTVSRGKRVPFIVQPITTPKPRDTSGRDWLTELADAAKIDQAAVEALGKAATAANADPVIVGLIKKAWRELAPATETTLDIPAGEQA